MFLDKLTSFNIIRKQDQCSLNSIIEEEAMIETMEFNLNRSVDERLMKVGLMP
mgnify:CR=1 FL=1